MATCPVCDKSISGGDAALERHVNAHFDNGDDDDDFPVLIEGPGSGLTTSRDILPAPKETCFICGKSLDGLDGAAANAHVNACLDGGEGGAPMPQITPEDYENFNGDQYYESDGESDPNELVTDSRSGRKIADARWDGTVFADKSGPSDKAAKGDKWWDPVRGSLALGAVPLNISPGLIPVLHDMLQRNATGGSTRTAVLARGGVHLKGSFGFDSTWGCGYRNALMAIANLQNQGLYSAAFSHRADPGVRSIQHWIEEAWRAGFDPLGREQLKGKLSGTQKWIGTSDLYAMFSYLGIPCTLYDFPKPAEREGGEPTHKVLERWTRAYFDADEPPLEETDAFTELMRPKVRIGTRNPFILQHAGHSRTVVGYELAGKDVNLLLFDPAKSVPKDVREAGMSAARAAREAVPAGSLNSNGNGSTSAAAAASPSTVRIQEDVAAADLASDEEVVGGWVRKKKAKTANDCKSKTDPLISSLGPFRTTLSRWKQNQFQVLVFTGEDALGAEARAVRKTPSSIVL